MHTPEEVVSQILPCRLLEGNDPAAGWIHAAENMTDDTVLTTGVESLKHYKKRMLLFRVHQALQPIHLLQLKQQLWQDLFIGVSTPGIGWV
jgi:hypothetical protein